MNLRLVIEGSRFQNGSLDMLNANWLLPESCNTEPVPQAFFGIMDIVVRNGSMRSNAIIPDGHGIAVPPNPDLTVGGV